MGLVISGYSGFCVAKMRRLYQTNSSSTVANEPEWEASSVLLFSVMEVWEMETMLSAVVIKEVFMEVVEPDLDL